MDTNKLAKLIRKNNKGDMAYAMVILFYLPVMAPFLYFMKMDIHFAFMVAQVAIILPIFTIRFMYSYLRVKKMPKISFRTQTDAGEYKNYLYEMARKGVLPGSYFTLILKKMIIFPILMAIYFIVLNFISDFEYCPVFAGLSIMVPVVVWALVRWCFELRISTRTSFRVVTAPLSVVKWLLGVAVYMVIVLAFLSIFLMAAKP